MEARKAASPAPAGPTQKADVAVAASRSGKTVAERKAETLEAAKKGELVPAGEGVPAAKK